MFPLLAKHSLKSDRLMAYKMQSCSAADRKVAKCRVLHSREICGFDRPAELRRRVACAQQRARVHAYVCVCVCVGRFGTQAESQLYGTVVCYI